MQKKEGLQNIYKLAYYEKTGKASCYPIYNICSNSILLEHFTDAKTMFNKMVKNKEIHFNLMKKLGTTQKAEEIFVNTGVFSLIVT